jgi:hypothetical protein
MSLFQALLIITSSLVAIEKVLYFADGYFAVGYLSTIGLLVMGPVRVMLLVALFIVAVRSITKKRHPVRIAISFIVIVGVSIIPSGNFDALGGLLSIYDSGPERILSDARRLLTEYPEMTHFSIQPKRYPLNHPIPKEELPSSIQDLNIVDVLVLDDSVLLEKHGLQGVFIGFIAFREDKDPWVEHKPYDLMLDACIDCWRIRIIDGLYWYHADPADPAIYYTTIE